MVNVDEFKSKIENQLTQEYKIGFLGKNFNEVVNLLTESRAEKIYNWINKVFQKQIQPITIGSKKSYKEWIMHELMIFRYPFNIKGVEYRILFVKVKNSFFIEFHLGDHKYYDKVRKELFLS
ncbi:hypothetical protein ACFL1H_01640 [Nanoarchaeota archaeon]